jgi:DNA-binding MarR family transcriptional regulator
MLSDISLELKTWFAGSMQTALNEFRKYFLENNLTLTQMNFLTHLYYIGPCEITSMTSLLETNKSAVSQLVDRLVNQGLLERAEVPGDRRSRELRLTEKGRSIVEGGIDARQKWFETICAQRTPQEQAEIFQALHTLNRIFSSPEEK